MTIDKFHSKKSCTSSIKWAKAVDRVCRTAIMALPAQATYRSRMREYLPQCKTFKMTRRTTPIAKWCRLLSVYEQYCHISPCTCVLFLPLYAASQDQALVQNESMDTVQNPIWQRQNSSLPKAGHWCERLNCDGSLRCCPWQQLEN